MNYFYNDPKSKSRRQSLRTNQTPAEKIIWSIIRNRQIAGLKFLRQYGVGPYILDFYCPATRVGIEVDGGQHAENKNAENDARRTAFLKTQEISIIRFWNNEVLENPEGVYEKLKEFITPPNLPLD